MLETLHIQTVTDAETRQHYCLSKGTAPDEELHIVHASMSCPPSPVYRDVKCINATCVGL